MGLKITKESDGGIAMVAAVGGKPIRIPVGYRPLLEGEQPDEFDQVYDLILEEWTDLGEEGIWAMQTFGSANPAPLVRRIGESEAEGE